MGVLEASCLQAASSPVPPGGLRKASLVGASLDRRWVSGPCSPSVFSLDVVQAFPFSPPLPFSAPVTENHLEQVRRLQEVECSCSPLLLLLWLPPLLRSPPKRSRRGWRPLFQP